MSKLAEKASNLKRKRNKKSKIQKNHQFDVTNIKIGDTIDLSRLLFTKKRNYLLNYKDNKQVNAKDLSGKVIALIFKSLVAECYDCYWETVLINLLDLHSKLHPTGGFEIVFLVVKNQTPDYFKDLGSTPRNCFLNTVSTLPWPAMMMSDKESRIVGVSDGCDIDDMPLSFIIDPRGVVSKCHATPLFLQYGAAGYPFTNERIDFLDSEDNLVGNHPVSVEKLLASPERDYLINSEGDQVPLHNLDNQVVALFFCPSLLYDNLTNNLMRAYQKLYENMKDFEIVFIYTHGWFGWWERFYDQTDEDSFKKAFEYMPWLALPFKDTDCNKKLQRIFQYTHELLGPKPDPMMVIIGPHGNFIEPMGLKILLSYGVWAYPFSRCSAVNLELERVKNVKLEKLWDLDSVFTHKNGSQVRFSQLVGKRIIVLSTGYYFLHWDRLRKLEAMYIKMKGTSDEFEVIQIIDMEDVLENAKALPWLMYYPFDVDSFAGNFVDLVFDGSCLGLIAFDHDGSVVRRINILDHDASVVRKINISDHSVVRRINIPTIGDNMVFPFYSGGKTGDMKNEVLLEVERIFEYKVKKLISLRSY